MLACPGPPRTLGLYRDGNRIAALPSPAPLDVGYAARGTGRAALPADPARRVLLAGASGGFRIAEVLALGAAHVRVLEPEPVLGSRAAPRPRPVARLVAGDQRVTLLERRPGRRGPRRRHLRPDRSVRRLPRRRRGQRHRLHAPRRSPPICTPWRRTASSRSRSRSATSRSMPCACWRPPAPGCWPPASPTRAQHVMVYRSAWNVRILLSAHLGRGAHRHAAEILRRPLVRRVLVSRHRRRRGAADIYNDLPAVSFAEGEVDLAAAPTMPSPTRRWRCCRRSRRRRASIRPVADHLRPAVLLRVLRLDRSSARSCSGWKSCRRRRSARWSIWRCWHRRW